VTPLLLRMDQARLELQGLVLENDSFDDYLTRQVRHGVFMSERKVSSDLVKQVSADCQAIPVDTRRGDSDVEFFRGI